MVSGGATKNVLVGISVKLEVLTKDKLRKFVFVVTKKQENDLDKWSVDFELLDREAVANDFARVVYLDVDLDLKKVPDADVQTTAIKGFNQAQVDFILTTVNANAQKFNKNLIKEDRMKKTVSNIFSARSA